VRTLTSTTPSIIYSAAQQIADFGTIQANVTIKIYQIGTIGRGFGGGEAV